MPPASASTVSIAPAELEGLRSKFEEDGYVVIKDAVPRETIERVTAAADRIVAEGGQAGRWYGKPETQPRLIEYRGLMNLDETFLELLAPPKVLPLVVRLLSPNIHLTSSQLIYLHPHAPRGFWHRDVIGSSEDLGYDGTPRMAVRVGYYLSDVSQPDTGITLFVRGSHRLREPLAVDPRNDDPPDVHRVQVNFGDAVLWENRTFHRAEVNGPDVRKAVMIQYGYRWMRAVDYITHPPEVLERCDPVERQLLAAHDINEDGSFTRMKGSGAVAAWAAEQGLV